MFRRFHYLFARGGFMKMYSMKDQKAGTFGSIMSAPNDGMMVRMLQSTVAPNDLLARYPEDFDLYDVGEFDDTTGRVGGDDESPRFVCNLKVVFNREN